MIDYLSTIMQCKVKPNFGNCKPEKCFVDSGVEEYSIQGCKKVRALWHPVNQLLEIKGSMPYFLKGHNFTSTQKELAEAVELIDDMLGGIGIWDSTLKEVENGFIIEVGVKPKHIISSHFAKKGSNLRLDERTKDEGRLRRWNEVGYESIKMYDAKANLMQKVGLSRRKILIAEGYNPESNYLKFETHIYQPHILLGGKEFRLNYLLDTKGMDVLNKRIIDDYNRLETMKTLVMPTDKKGLSCADIFLFSLAEEMMNNQSKPLPEIKKCIYQRINLIPDTILSKSDKNARKRQVSRHFSKLQEEGKSQWDLTSKLEEAIKQSK